MRRAIVAVVTCAGAACGRFGFDPLRVDDSIPLDGAFDAAMLGPFGTPQLLVIANSQEQNDDPVFSRDDLELYFASLRTGTGDLYRTARSSPTGIFSAVQRVGALSTTGAPEGYPVVSLDGLTIWFSRNSSVMTATRGSKTSPTWGAPVSAGIDGPGGSDKPGTTFDGDRQMIMESIVGTDRNLYLAQRIATDQPWSTIIDLVELNTSAIEGRPYTTADGLAVYFYSDRPGSAGEDLWFATRDSITEAFREPQRIAELATSGAERDPTLATDLRTIVFTRGSDLYMATR